MLRAPSVKNVNIKLMARVLDGLAVLQFFATPSISDSERHTKKSELPNPWTKKNAAAPIKMTEVLLWMGRQFIALED